MGEIGVLVSLICKLRSRKARHTRYLPDRIYFNTLYRHRFDSWGGDYCVDTPREIGKILGVATVERVQGEKSQGVLMADAEVLK